MISLFIKTRREQIFSGVLVLACMAAVFWIRMLPLSLPVTEELAEKIVGRDLRGQLARELEKKYPGGEWRMDPLTKPPAGATSHQAGENQAEAERRDENAHNATSARGR